MKKIGIRLLIILVVVIGYIVGMISLILTFFTWLILDKDLLSPTVDFFEHSIIHLDKMTR